MLSRKSLLTAIVLSFSVSSIGMAVMCARLKSVSGGEWHTLALMEDKTLWACGDNSAGQSGLGSSVDEVHSLRRVLGEDGVGHLQNIVTYDTGFVTRRASGRRSTIVHLRPGADASLASATRLHGQNGFRIDWIPAFAGTGGVYAALRDF